MSIKKTCDFCGKEIPSFEDHGTMVITDTRGDVRNLDICQWCGRAFEDWKKDQTCKPEAK